MALTIIKEGVFPSNMGSNEYRGLSFPHMVMVLMTKDEDPYVVANNVKHLFPIKKLYKSPQQYFISVIQFLLYNLKKGEKFGEEESKKEIENFLIFLFIF